MPVSKLQVSAKKSGKTKVLVTLKNPKEAPVAFFNRLAVVDATTNERVLPVFANDYYVSVVPGAEKTIELECPQAINSNWKISIEGWNFAIQYFTLK